MEGLKGDIALVNFLESSHEGLADPANDEVRLELYRAKDRIARASGQAALFDVEVMLQSNQTEL